MSGSVLAAGVGFLGPAVATWIALIVGVMAFYFLSVSRKFRTRRVQGPPQWRQSEPGEARNDPLGSSWVSQSDPVLPSQASFRANVDRAAAAVPEPRSELRAYDMEDYPDKNRGFPLDIAPGVSSRDHA